MAVNGHSTLSRDPQWYLERARGLPPVLDQSANPGATRAAGFREAFKYYLRIAGNAWRFLRPYNSHRPNQAILEAIGWGRRFLSLERRGSAERMRTLRRIATLDHFLLAAPAELGSPIRIHSPFANMRVAAEICLASFARGCQGRHPPRRKTAFRSIMVWSNWRRVLQRLGKHYHISERLHFVVESW